MLHPFRFYNNQKIIREAKEEELLMAAKDAHDAKLDNAIAELKQRKANIEKEIERLDAQCKEDFKSAVIARGKNETTAALKHATAHRQSKQRILVCTKMLKTTTDLITVTESASDARLHVTALSAARTALQSIDLEGEVDGIGDVMQDLQDTAFNFAEITKALTQSIDMPDIDIDVGSDAELFAEIDEEIRQQNTFKLLEADKRYAESIPEPANTVIPPRVSLNLEAGGSETSTNATPGIIPPPRPALTTTNAEAVQPKTDDLL